MRRRSIFIAVVALTSTVALCAEAQSRNVRRTPRAFLVVSDGIGPGSGGTISGSAGLAQVMRGSGVVHVMKDHGIDFSAVRVQMLIPTNSRFSDPDFNNPAGDAVFLSYASFIQQRGGGFPAVFTVGPGVMRRKTADPGRTRDTWAARIGYDGESLLEPAAWMDMNVSAHIVVMPGRDKSQMYVAALSLGFRIG